MQFILIWRGAVFLLALFYGVRLLVLGDWGGFGGPLRYLTNWAALLSLVAAGLMVWRALGRTDRRFDGFTGMVAVVNVMVVFLYWRLWFADPTSVTENGELGRWWIEYYYHGLGPALQWIDVLILHQGFRRPVRSGGALALVIGAYVAWAELVVGPMNARPAGTVTDGLPYPFLNDLDLAGRAGFYGTNLAVALVVLALMTGLAALIRRSLGTSRLRESGA
jgi:hypothetical protein